MAEERQDDQKPKTALIKHKKDSGSPDGSAPEKRKVRVVVKRKAKAKPDADTEEKENKRSTEVTSGPGVSSVRVKSEEPTPPKRQPRPTGKVDPSTIPPSVRAPIHKPGEERTPPPQSRRRDEGPGGPQRPRGDVGARRPPDRTGRPPQTGGPGRGRPSTGWSPPGRGPGRPGGGPPAPGRGAPPRGPAGGGGGGEEKKAPSKKFFKTKKRDYPKRDRHQEKQIQWKQKRQPGPKANPVPKEIDIMEVITVSELARKLNLKASDLIGKLMAMGMMVTINQQIDAETAEILAGEYGCKVNIVSLYDETIIETVDDKEGDLKTRPPVITVMGHVDHGKTKLLDAIRTTDVVAGEFGGITQHIGAYQVELPQGKLTFLDTPGHEAFGLMRARGAQITDIVILVVAADDGVMPQTREAVDHAKAADVPIIVAVNKIDLADANPDRVKQQLSELNLIPEDWGGSTLFCEVSALTGDGVPELLETVLLQSEVLELKANYGTNAEGTIVESRIDPGRGSVSTLLVQRGTLRVGDSFIAGVFPGRVRALFNDRGDKVEEASPAMPVEVLGITGVPNAGDPFQVTESDKMARQVGDKRQELRKVEEARNVKKITLDNLYDSIQAGAVQDLRVIIKGDVHGSVEAIQQAVEKLSTQEVRLVCIRSAAGAINEDDVRLASASDAIIVGFHVRPTPRALELAEAEKVEIRKYNVIYEVVDDIKSAMEGLLSPELREESIGKVEVRELFRVPKIGVIAGSYVTEGKVRRNASVHVIRDGVEVYSGKINSLKRFKDDAREVDAGYECGVGVENYNDLKIGDLLEVFQVVEHAKKLGEASQE
jgi:translation initiation factor IF-2